MGRGEAPSPGYYIRETRRALLSLGESHLKEMGDGEGGGGRENKAEESAI